jgi:hypothetical protein
MLSLRIWLTSACTLVLAALIPLALQAASGEGTEQVKEEQSSMEKSTVLLVKFKDDVSATARSDIHASLGVTVKHMLLGGSLHVVEVPYPDSLEAIKQAYQATPGVEYVEIEMPVSIPEPIEEPSDNDPFKVEPPGNTGPSIDSQGKTD